MMRASGILTVVALAALGSPAHATVYTEAFEGPFPAWESGWFGVNSNAQNYYGVGSSRGNNPDGLWLVDGLSNGSASLITFGSTFAAQLTSFQFDVAAYSLITLRIFDKNGGTLFSSVVQPTYGATRDPGDYANFSVNSANGIGGFSFSNGAEGGTSIDNIRAVTADVSAAVPEPSTWAMMLVGFGVIGFAMRRKQSQTVRLNFA